MGVLRRSDWVTACVGAVLCVWGIVVVLVMHELSGLTSADGEYTCAKLATQPRLTHHQKLWVEMGCEAQTVFSPKEVSAAVDARFPHERPAAVSRAVSGRRLDQDQQPVVVAVCFYADGALGPDPVMRMLESLADTVEPGFEYRVYMVYDEGDEVYDFGGEEDKSLKGTSSTADLQYWFQASVADVAIASAGVTASLIPIRLNNRVGKPGPAINVAVAAAYADGAEYMYRVHSDSVLLTPWAGALTAELQKSSPPNLGVVGPKCHQAPEATLMHDLTHRTHLEIFDTHHPVELEGLVAGEWIARVYGGLDSRHSRVVPSVKVARHSRHRANSAARQSTRLPFLRRQLLKHVKDGTARILEFLKAQMQEDGVPLDPTLFDTKPDRAELSRRSKALFKNGVYDKEGRVLVHPDGIRHPEADHRQGRFLKSWDAHPHPSDTDHWETAVEDFFVIHRLARARVSHCMSSGLC